MQQQSEALAALDLTSPFVAVTVDSGRINATLQALVAGLADAMKGVQRLETLAGDHGRALDGVHTSLKGHNDRIAQLSTAVASIQDVETRMATVERSIEARFTTVAADMKAAAGRTEAVGARVTALEERSEEAARKMEQSLAEAAALATRAEEAVKASDEKLDALRAAAAAADERAAAADAKASLIADVLDMDLQKARAMVDKATRTGNAVEAADGRPPRVSFCRALPSFASLEADLKRALLEEAATLKARLNEKLDATVFNRAERRIDDCVAAAKRNEAATELVQRDLAGRVTVGAFDDAIGKLKAGKADRSELVGMATHEDLRGISDMAKETRAYVERAFAELQLEAREARARDAAASNGNNAGKGGGAAAAEAARDLLERVQALERETRSLEERKADRKELRALQEYIDNAFANMDRARPRSARAATDPLTSTPRRRVPSPIARPGSASIPNDRNATPPPLYYTSLPVPHSNDPNVSASSAADRTGASTNVFDSNGHRTSANLSLCRPAPADEHYENIARLASDGGDASPLPPGYLVQDVRDLERPRSAPPVADANLPVQSSGRRHQHQGDRSSHAVNTTA